MTGLKIKGGDNIRAPTGEAFVGEGAAGVGQPDGFPERFGDVLFAVPLNAGIKSTLGGALILKFNGISANYPTCLTVGSV